jgi:molybdopterin converting factor small subunit
LRILFFGKLSEHIGREIELDTGPCDVAALRRALAQRFPDAAAELSRPSIRVWVDDVVVPEDFVVRPDQQVGFFPPLSGG